MRHTAAHMLRSATHGRAHAPKRDTRPPAHAPKRDTRPRTCPEVRHTATHMPRSATYGHSHALKRARHRPERCLPTTERGRKTLCFQRPAFGPETQKHRRLPPSPFPFGADSGHPLPFFLRRQGEEKSPCDRGTAVPISFGNRSRSARRRNRNSHATYSR